MKEREIEDELEKDLSKIEPGLRLIERQKRISTGIMDLFCRDRNGKYVIVEVKRKPNAKVVAQLAKYNMALIKNGISKKRLRTILVAQEFPKDVRDICEFFKFEIKNISKGISYNTEEKLNNKFNVSDKKKLIKFIKRKRFINQSMAARFLKIYNHTARDLINDLNENNLVNITHFAGNKVIRLKED